MLSAMVIAAACVGLVRSEAMPEVDVPAFALEGLGREGERAYSLELADSVIPVSHDETCYAPGTVITPELAALLEGLRRGGASPYEDRYNTSWTRRNSPITLTWSLVPDGTPLAAVQLANNGNPFTLFSTTSNLFGLMNANFPSQNQWIEYIQQMFDRYATLTGVEFVRVQFNGQPWDDGAPVEATRRNPAPGLRGDIRIMARAVDGPGTILAFAGNHITFDNQDSWNNNTGSYRFFRNVFAHELGHALGLGHVCPLNNSKLMEPFASTAFDGPQQDDLRGLQQIYGDVFEPNNSQSQATRLPSTIPLTSFTFLDYPFAGGQPGQLTAASLTGVVTQVDGDWYVSDVTVPLPLTIAIEPRGEVYDSSTQNSDGTCNSGTLVDSRAICRLHAELWQNGQRLAQSTALAPGQSVGMTVAQIQPGEYFVRVSSPDNFFGTQSYRMIRTVGAPQPPSNDACANARNRLTWPITGTTFGATNDGNAFVEPGGFSDGRDVYYRWTATGTGRIRVTANPTESYGGLVASIHNGTVCPATGTSQLPVIDATNFGGGLGVVDANVTRGLVYYIRVANRDRTSLGGTFDLNLQYLSEPAHTYCANAIAINAPDSTFTGNLDFARGSEAEACGGPLQTPTFNRSVWYSYYAYSDSDVTINTCNSNFDTYVAVYDRCPVAGDAPLACNDDGGFCSAINSRLVFRATGGQTYLIRLTNGATFNVNLNDSYILNISVRPANDTCANPQSVGEGSFTYDDAYGSPQFPVEPDCFPASGGTINHDVWYEFTATCNSTASLSIVPSPSASLTQPAIYPTCSASPGTTLACGASASAFALHFAVQQGVSYRIRAGSQTVTERVFGTMTLDFNCPVCPADLDDGTLTGTPDGGVTIDDLLYYLFVFEQGNIAADLDDGSGTGAPDGGVTIDDLLYFLVRFEGGC